MADYDIHTAFDAYAPGVVLTRDIESALLLTYAEGGDVPLSQAQVLAIVLPLMPEGNPPQYTAGAPPSPPLVQPGAYPLFPPALPPQPDVPAPIDGNPALGTVATFARGLPRFADSNPDPRDGWSIERDADGPFDG